MEKPLSSLSSSPRPERLGNHHHHHHTITFNSILQRIQSPAQSHILKGYQIPADEARNCLQWKALGENKNISGYCLSNELFAFIGDLSHHNSILKNLAYPHLHQQTAIPSKNKIKRNDSESSNLFMKERLSSSSSNASSRSSTRERDTSFYTDESSVFFKGKAMSECEQQFSYLDVDDVGNLYENLTVLETLVFSAELRGAESQLAELSALRTSNGMKLKDIADLPISALPVWQKRLILLASEVVADRHIIFFSSPTCDLDATSALELMTSLKSLLRDAKECTIIITASGLSFREFCILDRIQLLSTSGAVYFGLGANAVSYFETIGRTPSPGASIPDFLMEMVDEDVPHHSETEALERVAHYYGSMKNIALPAVTHNKNADEVNADVTYWLEQVKAGVGAKDAHKPFDMNDNSNSRLISSSVIDGGGGNSNSSSNSNSNKFKMNRYASHHQSSERFGSFSAIDTSLIEEEDSGLFGCDCLESEEGVFKNCGRIPVVKQFIWLFWRAFATRFRQLDQLIALWLLLGVLIAVGFSLTFFQLNNDFDEFEDKITFLTVFPFSLVLMSSLWNENDLNERNIFIFERQRQYYYESLFIITSLIADIVLYKIVPLFIAGLILYPVVGLRPEMDNFMVFLEALILISVVGAVQSKVVFGLMSISPSFTPIKASMANSFILSMQILYTGVLANLSKLDLFGKLMKNVSFFYWGCNLLYWNEMDGVALENVPAIFEGIEVTGGTLLNKKSIPKVTPSTAVFALTCQVALYTLLYVLIAIVFYRKWWKASSTGYSRFMSGLASSTSELILTLRRGVQSVLVCQPCKALYNLIFRRGGMRGSSGGSGSAAHGIGIGIGGGGQHINRGKYESIP